jgi:DNA polymerase-3 subunit alpha
MQNAHLEPQQRINPLLAKLAEGTGLGLVATGDVHYLNHEDARAHEALLCIQSGDSLKNPQRWKFDTDHFYFKSPQEMAQDFPGYEHALAARSRSRSAATSRSTSAACCCRNTRRPTTATPSSTSSS